jgi:surfeit locus 1 family protein
MQGRRLILLLFLAVLGTGLLVSLGLWQLDRRDWKNAIIADLERSIAAPPIAYSPPAPGAPPPAGREFRRVTIEGRFDHAQSVYVLTPARGRPGVAGFGYSVFTPLATQEGTVIVNRGYVPSRGALTAPDGVNSETVRISGIIRTPDEGSAFTPKAKPEQRLFYSANVRSMAEVFGWDEARGYVSREYIEADATNAPPGTWPQGRDPAELLGNVSNRHLEYALTWFGLAATLVLILLAYLLRGARRSPPEEKAQTP